MQNYLSLSFRLRLAYLLLLELRLANDLRRLIGFAIDHIHRI